MNPLFTQYGSNLLKADSAGNKGDIFSVEFSAGEIKKKRGLSWLGSQLSKLRYLGRPEARVSAEKTYYLSLLRENWNFLNNAESQAKPEYQAKILTPLEQKNIAKISHSFALSIKDVAPIAKSKEALKEFLNQRRNDLPVYARNLLAELEAVNLPAESLDRLAHTPPDKLAKGQETENVALVARCLDLKDALQAFREGVKRNYSDCFQFLEETGHGIRLKKNLPVAPSAAELAKIQQCVNLLNLFPSGYLDNIETIIAHAIPIGKYFDHPQSICKSLEAVHLQFQQDCIIQGISPEVEIVNHIPVPTAAQLKIAIANGYALFEKVPLLETDESRAFFARTIQYILLGNRMSYVLYPQDAYCFTCKELNKASTEHIRDEQNFFVWFLKSSGERNPAEALQYSLRGFFKDIGARSFPFQVLTQELDENKKVAVLPIPQIGSPEVFEGFIQKYRQDFVTGAPWEKLEKSYAYFKEATGITLPPNDLDFCKFIDDIPVDAGNPAPANAMKEILKENSRLSDEQWGAIHQHYPNKERKEFEKLWRFGLIQMMVVLNNNFPALAENQIQNRLAEGIPFRPSTGKEQRSLTITPFNVNVFNRENYPLAHDPETLLAHRPDYPPVQRDAVPLITYNVGVNLQDFNQVDSRDPHTVLLRHSVPLISPFGVSYLDEIIQRLAPPVQPPPPEEPLPKTAELLEMDRESYAKMPNYIKEHLAPLLQVDFTEETEMYIDFYLDAPDPLPNDTATWEILVRWLNLQPTLQEFRENIYPDYQRLKPYLEFDEDHQKYRIKEAYLPRIGENPPLSDARVQELQRFVQVLNTFPFDRVEKLETLGKRLINDDFITQSAVVHNAYIMRCIQEGVEPEVQFNGNEVVPTAAQLRIATACVRNYFSDLPIPPFDTPLAQSAFNRMVLLALVGKDELVNIRQPQPGFTTTELKGWEDVMDIEGHEGFLDWYLQEVNKVDIAGLKRRNPEATPADINRLRAQQFVGVFFRDMQSPSSLHYAVGNEEFQVHGNLDQFEGFLGALQSEYIDWLKEGDNQRAALEHLQEMEKMLGPLSTDELLRFFREAPNTQSTSPAINTEINTLILRSLADLEDVKGINNRVLQQLWLAHVLEMLLLGQQTTPIIRAGTVQPDQAGSDLQNVMPSLLKDPISNRPLGVIVQSTEEIFGVYRFGPNSFSMELTSPYSTPNAEVGEPIEGSPDIPTGRLRPILWATRELSCRDLAFVPQKREPFATLTLYRDLRIPSYMAPQVPRLVASFEGYGGEAAGVF